MWALVFVPLLTIGLCYVGSRFCFRHVTQCTAAITASIMATTSDVIMSASSTVLVTGPVAKQTDSSDKDVTHGQS